MVSLTRVGSSKNIGLFTIENREKANCYNDDILSAFMKLLKSAVDDPSIRAGIVTGAGERVFCSGADVEHLSQRSYLDGLNLLSRRLFENLSNAPWPTIAAINGAAIGGGLELSLACDIRVCKQSSWFALPEVDFGIIPAAGGVARLSKLIGESRAKAMILFGEKIDGKTALEWGLVHSISKNVLEEAITIAKEVEKRDALAIRLAKMAIQSTNTSVNNLNIDLVSQALLYDRKKRNKSK
mmetsp:Transcript_10535/g.24453  ORF Transcript_10535/g.24453 Transcript_10535/m.24453 type:complete len:240 (-) Transcript_10535:4421-5140(-)